MEAGEPRGPTARASGAANSAAVTDMRARQRAAHRQQVNTGHSTRCPVRHRSRRAARGARPGGCCATGPSASPNRLSTFSGSLSIAAANPMKANAPATSQSGEVSPRRARRGSPRRATRQAPRRRATRLNTGRTSGRGTKAAMRTMGSGHQRGQRRQHRMRLAGSAERPRWPSRAGSSGCPLSIPRGRYAEQTVQTTLSRSRRRAIRNDRVVVLRGDAPEADGLPHQHGDALGLHLLHDLGAVAFDRPRADLEVRGDRLAGVTGRRRGRRSRPGAASAARIAPPALRSISAESVARTDAPTRD